MNQNSVSYIQTLAFLNEPITVSNKIGAIVCPRFCDLMNGIVPYINIVFEHINLYDDDKDNFFNIISSEDNRLKFALFLSLFIKVEKIKWYNDRFTFQNNTLIEIDASLSKDGYIDKDNIAEFMDTIKILHHVDNPEDHYKVEGKLAREMLKRIKAERKRVRELISNKNGLGFFEILSSVSARHPSINPINIKQLNYFQLIQEFIQLNKIDDWNVNMNAVANGNMQQDQIKNIKHYASKTGD